MTSIFHLLSEIPTSKMAGVLFVVYIPCDESPSNDPSGTEGKREPKGPGASQAGTEKDDKNDDEAEKENAATDPEKEDKTEADQENSATEKSPLVESDSGFGPGPELGSFRVKYIL